MLVALFVFSVVMWEGALSYPGRVPCSDAIDVGQTWMGVESIQDNTHYVQVFRGVNQLNAGASYTPGEMLTVTFSTGNSGTGSQFMIATDYGSFPGDVCGGSRIINIESVDVTMPASGSVSFWVASAGGYGQNVGITASFTLTPLGAASPTPSPSVSPSRGPSARFTLRPTKRPTKRPSGKPSLRAPKSPTKRPISHPSRRPRIRSSKKAILSPSRRHNNHRRD